MAEDNIVVKTIEDVDKLFSQIVVNGEVFDSERYVEPEPKPVVVKKALVKKAEVKRSTVQTEPQNTTRSENTRSVQGENVYAVELNDILHNFEDRAIVQALSEEAQTRAGADEHLQQSITDINSKIPSTASSSNKLADNASVGTSINNAIGALDVASAGGNGKYIKAISETDGKISAVTGNIDSSVNEGSSNPVTGGAVHSAIQAGGADAQEAIDSAIATEVENRNSAISSAISTEVSNRNTAISNAIAEEVSNRNTAISNAVEALDVASAGGNGKYIKSISETDGKISATTGGIDSSVTAGSSNPVTGGAVDTAINVVKASVEDIEALIPNQATEQNQLADKAFVNSSITSNTANFLGTYTSLAQIQAIPDPTNNDYAFLQTTDSAGNTEYQRYKYSTSDNQWHYEYTLNNSSFTAEQWATINSGLTQESVTAEIGEAISGEVTARNSAISSAIDTEVANRNTAISNAIDTEVSNRNTAISNAVEALDVASAGGNGKYIKSISETDGKISATTGDIDSSVTAGSSNPVTGGAVATALSDKVDKVTGKGLSTNDFTDAMKNKLNGIESGAQVNAVTGVKGSAETDYRTGDISISKDNIGLGDVVNTGDSAVPSENGTEKFTTGGAYTELNKKADISSLAVPSDAVLHYSFDEVPDYPDGTAVYRKNNDFIDKDGWVSDSSGTFTVDNGKLVFTGGRSGAYIYKHITTSNSLIIATVITDRDRNFNFFVNGSGAVTKQFTLKANIPQKIYIQVSGDMTAVGFSSFVNGEVFTIESFYVGDGSYSTPIIDNANGQNNATNNGSIAVKGVSGKGAYFPSALQNMVIPYDNMPVPNSNKDITISLWLKMENDYPLDDPLTGIVRIGAYVGCFGLCKSNKSIVFFARDTSYTRLVYTPFEKGIWHNYTVVYNGTTHKGTLFDNGVKIGTTQANEENFNFGGTNNNWYIWGNTLLTGSGSPSLNKKAYLDDLLIFDRALTETEVMALYLNKANTPKYYTKADMVETEVTEELAIKQPKTLDTPVTVGDVQQTTVEGALGALAQASATPSVETGTVVTSMGSVPQGYLDCGKRMIEKFVQNSSLPTSDEVYALLQTTNGAIYASVDAHAIDGRGIYKSIDRNIFTQLSGFPANAVVYTLLQTADGAVYAGGSYGIYKSTDGSTFTQLSGFPAYTGVYTLLQTADEAIYAGTNGLGIYKSTDGSTFTQLSGFPTNVVVRALLQTADGAIYAGTTSHGIYKSTDGSTFTQLSGFPTGHSMFVLLQTADGAIYAGTNGRGMYKSTDGSTFTQLSGFPTGYTVKTLLQSADGTIYAGTFDYGIYKSTDGSTFTQLSGFLSTNVYALLQTADEAIYAGTSYHGIYKSVPFRELDKTIYADLYAVVGDKFNAEAEVTDNTKFAIPLVGNDKLTYMVKA